MRLIPLLHAAMILFLGPATGCGGGSGDPQRRVTTVLDGDTVELENGERVRLLGIDAPERGAQSECHGDESFNFLSDRIGGRKVRLEYDLIRKDTFGRTLAWVYLGTEFVNATMLADGQACLLIIPPNGESKASYLQALETQARATGRGLWSACGGCDVPEGS